MYYICQRKIGSSRVNTSHIDFRIDFKREKKFRVLITHLCLNILIRFRMALFLVFQINIFILNVVILTYVILYLKNIEIDETDVSEIFCLIFHDDKCIHQSI